MLRTVRPRRLYFAVDGPRSDFPGDHDRVLEVQRLASTVDWDCEVHNLFRPVNLGCKAAVSEAITWFFDQVEAGVILEDDCVPHPTFFPFAQELLERFRDDPRVIMISGNNFQFGRTRTAYSYYFSRYTHIWGWATWRRGWRLYDHAMSQWPEHRDGRWLMDLLRDKAAVAYWTRIFEDTWADRNTPWAYRWLYSAWITGALTVLPNCNLVSNVGFDRRATHTANRWNVFADLPREEIPFPLLHPPCIARNDGADRYTERRMFSGSVWRRLAGNVLRRLRGVR